MESETGLAVIVSRSGIRARERLNRQALLSKPSIRQGWLNAKYARYAKYAILSKRKMNAPFFKCLRTLRTLRTFALRNRDICNDIMAKQSSSALAYMRILTACIKT